MQAKGATAVVEYTSKFDGLVIENFIVDYSKIENPDNYLTIEQKQAIVEAYERVFAAQQIIAKQANKDVEISKGLMLKTKPIERVGIYVPGGKSPLPSSLLMAGATAKAAGVKDIFVCTPPSKTGVNPGILYVAKLLGITDIYTAGGAQAIAAMSLGIPELIKKADMICGPGNVYVTAAKGLASSKGLVKIDMLAGPSEVFVIADETGNAEYIAADMLAQAEHGSTSAAILATNSKEFAEDVKKEIAKQLDQLQNKEATAQAIRDYGSVVLTKTIQEAVDIANSYAPEHLEIFVSNPEEITKQNLNAGAVFVNTGEVFADYGFTGGNHILPTGGSAKFSSALSVYDFIVRYYVEQLSQSEQKLLARKCSTFAKLEQLEAHSRAAEKRGRDS